MAFILLFLVVTSVHTIHTTDRSTLQITTWNTLNPAYENEQWYVSDAIKHLHWSTNRQKRATEYLVSITSHVFSLQETTRQMVQQFTRDLSNAHGIDYKYYWHEVLCSKVTNNLF
eukprot:TRINITY_DN901_c0_g3_i6.p1 TRINITY_DN901_c0_g3~~TRINITY_DN901_c0_g3_i6.p1  ORF type:complete len:115 (-),score=10.33 TRINITY_DN901_c0_g3_i6:682-1026(-)